jgi:hypothetical protein
MGAGGSLKHVSAGIVQAAQDDDALFLLIGGRIVQAEDPTLRDMELPAVAFRYLPGRSKYPLRKVWTYTVQFLIYSNKSYEEAEEVYEALTEALSHKGFQHTGGTNFEMWPNQAPSSNFIEEDGEFIYSVFWTVKAIDP